MKLAELKGIGSKKLNILRDMGVLDIHDLLYYFPRSFEDRRQKLTFQDDLPGYFVGTVLRKNFWQQRGKKSVLTVIVQSDAFQVKVIFFQSPYLEHAFEFQKEYIFFGKVEKKARSFQMVHPAFAPINEREQFLGLIPRYALKRGLYQSEMLHFIEQALHSEVPELFFPEDLQNWNLMPVKESLRQMHQPSSKEAYKKAKYRLIFEDFFRYLISNRTATSQKREAYQLSDEVITRFQQQLPFALTEGQLAICREILTDVNRPYQMTRLLQGDVGSGKSVLAYFLLFVAAVSSHQGVYLAPTELLAIQQYELMLKYFPERTIALLTSSTKQKKALYKQIAEGKIEILIGTHAILQEEVVFKDLDVIVTDEQHRFGVEQREIMKRKGRYPHILMMSATPIPRTMSMIMHQNIAVSNLHEKPLGRLPIETFVIAQNERKRAFLHILNEVRAGHKAYVIFPLIEESEVLEARSLEESKEELNRIFGSEVDFLHGRMPSSEKQQIIERFQQGFIHVLAATSLVEVGIDVKDATVMLLMNAERFGLSQIHQIRGRIGRSNLPSTCYLCYNKQAPERLQVLAEHQDGFEIAELDLKLRGPGEVYGTRQSGNFEFPVADIFRHSEILKLVNGLLDEHVLARYRDRLNQEVPL